MGRWHRAEPERRRLRHTSESIGCVEGGRGGWGATSRADVVDKGRKEKADREATFQFLDKQ